MTQQKTVFVMPDEREIVVRDLVQIFPGDQVMINCPKFGLNVRRCRERTHTLDTEGGAIKYTLRYFME